MARYFDRTTKCAFRGQADPHYIRFGSARDRNPKLKITAGKLRLEGFVPVPSFYASTYFYNRKEIASFFEPSIKCITHGVLTQCRIAHQQISVSIRYFRIVRLVA